MFMGGMIEKERGIEELTGFLETKLGGRLGETSCS